MVHLEAHQEHWEPALENVHSVVLEAQSQESAWKNFDSVQAIWGPAFVVQAWWQNYGTLLLWKGFYLVGSTWEVYHRNVSKRNQLGHYNLAEKNFHEMGRQRMLHMFALKLGQVDDAFPWGRV